MRDVDVEHNSKHEKLRVFYGYSGKARKTSSETRWLGDIQRL